MKKNIIAMLPLILLSLLSSCFAEGKSEPQKPNPIPLHVQDGQLSTRPFRVFVQDKDLTKSMEPEMCLVRLTKETAGKSAEELEKYCLGKKFYRAFEVARDQEYKAEHSMTGTLLLFNISDLEVPTLYSGMRVLPVLRWSDPEFDDTRSTVSSRDIYVSSRVGTTIWTLVVLVAFIVAIIFLMKNQKDQGIKSFLFTAQDYMSISLTQMGLWTLGIGAMVLGFGLMRMEVPHIPDTLVWLMGLSTTTTVVGNWQGHTINSNLKKRGRSKQKRTPKWGDLLMVYVEDDSGKMFASLPKAQLLFWTVISLVLFVVKSIHLGELWEVPEQLVFLMGVSQSGYLGRNQLAVVESAKEKKPSEEASKRELKDQTS